MADGDTRLKTRLVEQEEFESPEEFAAQANVSDPAVCDELEENWPDCWERAAEMLDWGEKYDEILGDSSPPLYKWFTGGKLNVSYNCVDRHIENGDKNHVAIKWEGEHGGTRTYTYQDPYREVNEFATTLRDPGVEEDDVVTLHMLMTPELSIAMLAYARIGAPHSVVFGGFSAEALATRTNAADSRLLVTCNGYCRRSDPLDHLDKANESPDDVDHGADATVAVDRLGDDGFDHDLKNNQHDWNDLLDEHAGKRIDPIERDAEGTLLLMYASGTTGQSKGVKHTTGGYLMYAAWTSHAILGIEREDAYWCSVDIGWITGYSYAAYEPLAFGTTIVMYERTPDFPNRDRPWDIIEKYAVDILYTVPMVIRVFMKWGNQFLKQYDLLSLRLLGTMGEPINPRAWKWHYKRIGNEDCLVVDTWWQTETGGMMVTTLPRIKKMKPDSAGPSLPGIDAQIVDTSGKQVDAGCAGYLTMNKPWSDMLRMLCKNDECFIQEYWQEHFDTGSDDPDDWVYFPEDDAKIDGDDYTTILGRVDDAVNVPGHRLGMMEIESAIVSVEGVAEAVVIGGNHEVKDEAVYVYAITEESQDEDDEMRGRITEGVEDAIGPIARLEVVMFTPELLKTRSGKITHRLLEEIANGEELGDTTTLRNPEVVESIQRQVESE